MKVIGNYKNTLLQSPELGDVIQGADGLRKVRVTAKGKGKRGGARVIYYYFDKVSSKSP